MQKTFYIPLVAWACLGLVGFGREARAQADFRGGYIVHSAGDTLRGLVDFRDSRLNGRQCSFRPSAEGAVVTYMPADLQGYGYAAARPYYRAVAVPAPGGGAAPKYFAEVLVSGPASLYYLRDDDRKDHLFVATPAQPLTELLHKTVKVEREGQTYYEEQNLFRNTLAQALPGCPAAQALLPKLPFTERALASALETYNACALPAAAPAAPTKKGEPLVTVGLLVGVKQSRLQLNSADPSHNADLGSHTSPVVGVALALPFARSRTFSLQVDVLYETQKYTLNTQNDPSAAKPGIAFNFDLAYLRAPVLVRYALPHGRLRPLVEAGGTVSYALKTDNSYHQYAGGYASTSRPVFEGDGFRQLEIGVVGGLGVSTNAWQGRALTLMARYERSSGCSGYTGVGSLSTHVYGLLSLDLFK